MSMNAATSSSHPIDYEQVIELVSTLPPERLRSAYDYLLFLAAQPLVPFPTKDLFDESVEELRADEERWNRQFSETRSSLRALAHEAAEEYRTGATKPMMFGDENDLGR